jgi:hypothetical protein
VWGATMDTNQVDHLACIIVGAILSLAGAVGHTSWTASALGLSTSLNDAAPGVIVFVVGIFMVLITRFRVREERTPERHHVVYHSD